MTDRELLEAFPEAKEILPIKIRECELAIKEKEAEIQTALNKIYMLETDSFSEWFAEQIIKMNLMPDLDSLESKLFRLKRLERLLAKGSKAETKIDFQEKIESARLYPIEEVARDKLELRQAGRNFVSLCPFHNEKTPSFYIYPETNRFYCFGCQEKGDVITLTVALYGIEFKEAVELLQN